MAIIDSLKLLITGDASQFVSETRRASTAAKSAKGAIDTLKGGFGARSALKDVFEIAKGGGAIIGATFALSSINRMISGLGDLDRQISKTGGGWREWVDGLARSIPITGQVIQIIDNLTGAGEKLRDRNIYTNAVVGFKGEAEKFMASGDELRQYLLGLRADFIRDDAMSGATGARKTFLTAFFEQLDETDKAKQKIDDLRKAAEAFREAVAGNRIIGSSTTETIIGSQINTLGNLAGIVEKRMAAKRANITKDYIGQVAGEKLGPAMGGVGAFFSGLRSALEDLKQLGERGKRRSLMNERDDLQTELKRLQSFRPDSIGFASMMDTGQAVGLAAQQMARMQFGPDEQSQRDNEIERIRIILENLDGKISVN